MDGEKQVHTSVKQHLTVSYEIWQTRNLPNEYLRSYTCFQEEFIFKQEEHDIIGMQYYQQKYWIKAEGCDKFR
jgi:hypothetical protein